jgi:hypothetical protein
VSVRRAFYARHGFGVFLKSAMLCPILLQAAVERRRATKVAISAANGRCSLVPKRQSMSGDALVSGNNWATALTLEHQSNPRHGIDTLRNWTTARKSPIIGRAAADKRLPT